MPEALIILESRSHAMKYKNSKEVYFKQLHMTRGNNTTLESLQHWTALQSLTTDTAEPEPKMLT